MADPTTSSSAGAKRGVTSLPQLVLELRDLVLAYVRQEAIDPIKSLGRYVAFGVGGGLLLGLGVVMLGVGALRILQVETGSTFHGDWSWVPYLIVVVVLLVGAAITWKTRGARRARELRRAQ